MRRAAVITLLVLGMAASVAAQSRSISFSLKGGIDYANLNVENSDSDNPDYLLGFGGGITLGTAISPAAGIDLDVLYMRKGAQEEFRSGMDEGETITFETKLDYVILSPLLRLAPAGSGPGIYFLGGPEFGYLVKATSTSSHGDSGYDVDIIDNYKEIDIGASFGMGFSTSTAGGAGFFVEGRYAMGFTDLVNEDYAEELGYTPTIKTRGIYLFGGLRF
ncbi:MAG: porin family protein [Candidatus Eisenbacteria bacterium]